jgi:oligopeptide transport system ATP-binding protein
MRDPPVLEAEHLRKVFRVREPGQRRRSEVVAVDDVSFPLEKGRALAIVGESGSGKTTTARIIVGLERPTTGRIVLGGRERGTGREGSKERRRLARHVQIVFQDPYSSLNPRQRVSEAIEEVLKLHFDLSKTEREARVRQLLDEVGLDERQGIAYPKNLSGGQRQRVAIARGLAAEPEVLILDEAVASLDVSIQAQVLNLLAKIRRDTGISYLFISHDLAVVRQVSDDTIVMWRGQVVERGPTDTILTAPGHPYTQLLLESAPRPGWKPHRRPRELAQAEAVDP